MSIDYSELNEITVKSQDELDAIPLDFKGRIYIEFGTYYTPAIVRNKYYRTVEAMGKFFGCSNGKFFGCSKGKFFGCSNGKFFGCSKGKFFGCSNGKFFGCSKGKFFGCS